MRFIRESRGATAAEERDREYRPTIRNFRMTPIEAAAWIPLLFEQKDNSLEKVILTFQCAHLRLLFFPSQAQ